MFWLRRKRAAGMALSYPRTIESDPKRLHPHRSPRPYLRWAPGLAVSDPLRCAPRRGVARSEPESRCADRTGKLDWWRCRLDKRIALWIERDDGDRRPVSGLPAPASWVALPRILINRMAGLEQRAILPGMTLCRGDVADAAMAVPVVIPLHKPNRPLPRGVKVGKAFGREPTILRL
jgi:hypothetical protein